MAYHTYTCQDYHMQSLICLNLPIKPSQADKMKNTNLNLETNSKHISIYYSDKDISSKLQDTYLKSYCFYPLFFLLFMFLSWKCIHSFQSFVCTLIWFMSMLVVISSNCMRHRFNIFKRSSLHIFKDHYKVSQNMVWNHNGSVWYRSIHPQNYACNIS